MKYGIWWRCLGQLLIRESPLCEASRNIVWGYIRPGPLGRWLERLARVTAQDYGTEKEGWGKGDMAQTEREEVRDMGFAALAKSSAVRQSSEEFLPHPQPSDVIWFILKPDPNEQWSEAGRGGLSWRYRSCAEQKPATEFRRIHIINGYISPTSVATANLLTQLHKPLRDGLFNKQYYIIKLTITVVYLNGWTDDVLMRKLS